MRLHKMRMDTGVTNSVENPANAIDGNYLLRYPLNSIQTALLNFREPYYIAM